MIGIIARREIRALFGAPHTWWMLGALQFLLAWQFLVQLELFQQVLPKLRQLAEPPGAAQLVINPLYQVSAFLLLILVPVITMQSLSGERRLGLLNLWYSAPVSLPALVLGKYLGVMALLGTLWSLLLLPPLALRCGTPLDFGTTLAGLLALALLMSAATALGLWCSALSAQPMMAAVGGCAVLLGLWLVDWLGQSADASGVLSALSLLAHFQRMARGYLHVFDVAYFLLLTALGLTLAMLALAAEPHGRRLRYPLASLAALGLALGLGALAARLDTGVDLTASQRHTLAPASHQALQAIPAPLSATAYLPPGHAALATVRDLVARYQRQRPDFELSIVDPAAVPELMRAENLAEGMLVLRAGSRSESLSRYHEQDFTRALIKLTRAEAQWIAFTTGHGERSPERIANFDLQAWARVLRGRGYRVQELDLAAQGVVPDNTSLLVLASPLLEFAPVERALIEAYLARGGALLWLTEPDGPEGLAWLGKTLGAAVREGTIFEPAGRHQGVADPSLAMLTAATDHASTQGLRGPVLLPRATAWQILEDSEWQAKALLQTSADAWLEREPEAATPAFNAATEARGPLLPAVALTRHRSAAEQRAVLVGDGDFLSNTYLGNGANQDFGAHLVDWLVANEALVGVETRAAPDVALEFSRRESGLLGGGLLLVLPMILVATGFHLARRRRHA